MIGVQIWCRAPRKDTLSSNMCENPEHAQRFLSMEWGLTSVFLERAARSTSGTSNHIQRLFFLECFAKGTQLSPQLWPSTFTGKCGLFFLSKPGLRWEILHLTVPFNWHLPEIGQKTFQNIGNIPNLFKCPTLFSFMCGQLCASWCICPKSVKSCDYKLL